MKLRRCCAMLLVIAATHTGSMREVRAQAFGVELHNSLMPVSGAMGGEQVLPMLKIYHLRSMVIRQIWLAFVVPNSAMRVPGWSPRSIFLTTGVLYPESINTEPSPKHKDRP